MSENTLPPHPHMSWYRKAAKAKLVELRRTDPSAKLALAQLAVAREHGFPSWRKLVTAIEALRAGAKSAEIFDAIRRDDHAAITKLLDADPGLVEARTPAGETPLHVAAEINNPDTIRVLLAKGADPKSHYGGSAHTALSWAVTTMAFEAAETLVEAGVKPDLFCAAGLGRLDLVRPYFGPRGTVRRNASRTGSSRFAPDGSRLPCPPTDPREVVSDALYLACRNARVDVARDLLRRDGDLGFRAFLGGTPLHWAYFGGSREIVEMLLAAGADPALRDFEYDASPRAFGIVVPACWGIASLVVARLKEDRSLATEGDARTTPLHAAAHGGHEGIVRLLLACGADPAARDREGKTPAERAQEGDHEAVRAILAGG